MKIAAGHQDSANHVRMGAAAAVGAVTLLWVGGMHAAFFQAGTVLLVVSLIPLARGLGGRGGAIIGLLVGLVWIAAKLGFSTTLSAGVLFSEIHVMVVAAMTTIGGLAGILFGTLRAEAVIPSAAPGVPSQREAAQHLVPLSASALTGLDIFRGGSTGLGATNCNLEAAASSWAEALVRHREWLATWDQASYPWTSFDNHVRELIRLLTGLQRLRCYRVSDTGQLYPLSKEHKNEPIEPESKDLLAHVVTTGRRFLAGTASSGPLVQELADSGAVRLVWAVPIRDRQVSIGVVTAETMGEPPAGEAQLEAVTDFIEEIWLHVYHLDLLRQARHTDPGSGLINRTDFFSALGSTLEHCYKLHEPVVIMVVCLEGLRGLDDASHWAKRDELVERVGQTIACGIRKDDLVGRFSDAQFVALLRRLDLPLAELICRKLLASIAKVICDFDLGTWVTPRAGLSGSGFAQLEAEALLRRAICALQKARAQDVLLVSQPPPAS